MHIKVDMFFLASIFWLKSELFLKQLLFLNSLVQDTNSTAHIYLYIYTD